MNTETEARAASVVAARGGDSHAFSRALELLREAGIQLVDTERGDFTVRWVSVLDRGVPPEADTIIRTITRTTNGISTSTTHWLEGLKGPRADARMLESLIARYGYFAILAGTFLEGETVLLIGGAMAHHGVLSLPLVIACAFLASFLGDQMWFVVGRRWGPQFLQKRPAWTGPAERVRRWLDRWGTGFVLAFRFIYGIRVLTPVMLGASGYPASRFIPLNAVGAALWACLVTGLGWGVGEGLTQLLGRAGKVEERALVALLVGVVIALAARHWTRGRAARRTPT